MGLNVTLLTMFALLSAELASSLPDASHSRAIVAEYYNRIRILTDFPFPHVQLGMRLGATYPWLNYIAKEPLVLRW